MKTTTRWTLLVLAGFLLLGGTVTAQERFVTQSGGRGLQNAKMTARVSKAERDIGVIFEDLEDIEDHARATMAACSTVDNKLRWTGTAWTCDQETDPTVQDFAKQPLPSCVDGTILSAQNGRFECVEDEGLLSETDPTVMDFAKTPLPNCGAGQVLKSNGNGFECVTDDAGITVETDPNVKGFAKVNPPSCATGEVLKSNGVNLFCVTDDAGLTVETDPAVHPFARNDQTGYTFAACTTDNVLTTNADGTQLVCIPDQGSAADAIALGDLSDVDTTGAVANRVLQFDGTNWIAGTETDPNVQDFAKTAYTLAACASGQVLTTNGDASQLVCANDAGGSADPINLGELGDVTITAVANGEVLRYNGTAWVNSSDKIGTLTNNKWCTSDGSDITCGTDAPVTCSSPNVIRWTGTTWDCLDISAGVSNNISLTDLSDVDTTGATSGQVLMFNGTTWVDATLNQIAQGDSAVVVADSGSGAAQIQIDGSAAVHVDSAGDVGIGTTNPTAKLEVVGGVSATSLNVTGNSTLTGDLTVTGDILTNSDLTVQGVTFSQGGISATGDVSATNFYGNGSNLTNVTASNVDWYGVTSIPTGVVNISNTALDTAELQQLQNIGTNTISAAQWGYVGLMNQDVSTTADVTFNSVTANTVNLDGGSIDGTIIGAASPAAASFTTVATTGNATVGGDLTVVGNLLTSSDLTVQGVTFSQGGISATGDVSATNFYGDGSNLTNIIASSIDWYDVANVPTGVVNISNTALDTAEL
ncbi:MAG: hypothetical protein OXQ96_05555, partial [Alphaproteobacteria bacterium]|nr:hypothetical protein [Alphaproteobacteria bacterium]